MKISQWYITMFEKSPCDSSCPHEIRYIPLNIPWNHSKSHSESHSSHLNTSESCGIPKKPPFQKGIPFPWENGDQNPINSDFTIDIRLISFDRPRQESSASVRRKRGIFVDRKNPCHEEPDPRIVQTEWWFQSQHIQGWSGDGFNPTWDCRYLDDLVSIPNIDLIDLEGCL